MSNKLIHEFDLRMWATDKVLSCKACNYIGYNYAECSCSRCYEKGECFCPKCYTII